MKITNIHLSVRRWRDRVMGNSYFSGRIYVNGEEVTRMPFQYGYGSQPDAMALVALREAGVSLDSRAAYLGSACRDAGIAFTEDDCTVLKRDVQRHGAASPEVVAAWLAKKSTPENLERAARSMAASAD